MKNIVAACLMLLVGAGLLLMMGCQSKEVTSAKVYIQQDDWDKAIEQLEMAVETYPSDAEAHMLLGRGYGKKGWYKKMVDEFNASLAISPKFENEINQEKTYYWSNEFNAAVKSFNAGELENAVQRFETCLLIDSSRVESYKNLASCYQRDQKIDKAIEVYKLLLKRTPNDVEALLRISDFYNTEKQHNEAIETLKSARDQEPENVDVLSALAITYDMKGDTAQAFQVYNQAIKKNPDNVDLLFNLGRLYFMRGDYENAISNFDKVIAQNPNDFQSNLNVGNAYLSIAEKMDKALKAKENETQKEYPEEREKIKDYYRKVIPYLEKALEIKPDEAAVWNNLAVAYIRTDDVEKGKEAFKKSEELNKDEN